MREHRRVVHPKGSPFASPKAKVQEHLAASCDINEIVAKARRGIAPTNVREGVPSYLDVSDSPESLQDAYSRVEKAEAAFSALPAKARAELDNDPRRLLAVQGDFFERHGLTNPKPPEPSPEPAKGAPSPKGGQTQPGKAPKPDEGDDE